MWCAYIFMAIALISLPNALKTHDTIVIVSWVAQTFLQLVLLSIIMVGQDVQSTKTQEIINETHFASLSEFELAKEARAIAPQAIIEYSAYFAGAGTGVPANYTGQNTITTLGTITTGTVAEARPDEQGATLAVHSMLGYGGGFVGPLAIGWTLDLAGGMSPLGWGLAFTLIAGLMAVALLVFLRIRPRELAGDRGT